MCMVAILTKWGLLLSHPTYSQNWVLLRIRFFPYGSLIFLITSSHEDNIMVQINSTHMNVSRNNLMHSRFLYTVGVFSTGNRNAKCEATKTSSNVTVLAFG